MTPNIPFILVFIFTFNVSVVSDCNVAFIEDKFIVDI